MLVRRITNPSLRPEESLGKELCKKTGKTEWDRGSACVKSPNKNDEGTSASLIGGQNSWRNGEWGAGGMVIR